MSVASRSSSPQAEKPFVGLRSTHRRFVSASVCEPGTAYGTFLVTISFYLYRTLRKCHHPQTSEGREAA